MHLGAPVPMASMAPGQNYRILGSYSAQLSQLQEWSKLDRPTQFEAVKSSETAYISCQDDGVAHILGLMLSNHPHTTSGLVRKSALLDF